MLLSLSRTVLLAGLQRQALCSISALATNGWCHRGNWPIQYSTTNTNPLKAVIATTRRLASSGISPRTTTQMTIHRFNASINTSRSPSTRSLSVSHGDAGGQQLPNKPGHYLEKYCTDLTALAEANKLDPVIGRHEEIRKCLQILSRGTKWIPVCKASV